MPSVFTVLSVFSAFSALSAQSVPVAGQVVNADSAPVPGVRVVLHRIGREAQGPLDSTRSDREGRFRFSFRPDTSSFYLVSGRFAGIEYFSSPLATDPAQPEQRPRVVVYDTSSTAPVELEARHLVLTRPAEDGARSMLDLIMIRNSGRLTRIAPQSPRGAWGVPLPKGTMGLEIGESDLSSEAISRRGDSLLIGAAIAPGEKQLTVQYQVPAATPMLELPIGGDSVPLNILAEESAVRVSGPGIARADSQVIQGRSFLRWTGTAGSRGVLRIILPGAPRIAGWILPALVGSLALGLAGAAWFALTRRRPRRNFSRRAEIVDAIAALDLRYRNHRAETPDEEWSAYLAQRTHLKRELETLAAGGMSR
jgi:hypothetical protein